MSGGELPQWFVAVWILWLERTIQSSRAGPIGRLLLSGRGRRRSLFRSLAGAILAVRGRSVAKAGAAGERGYVAAAARMGRQGLE